MAVARITASREWMMRASMIVRSENPKLARELLRAADRPGLTAELMADEARALHAAFPGDPMALQAVRDVEESEGRERARGSARDHLRALKEKRGA